MDNRENFFIYCKKNSNRHSIKVDFIFFVFVC